jgi:hypothetical protein
VAVAGEQAHATAVPPHHQVEAVMLDLVQPGDTHEGRRNEAGREDTGTWGAVDARQHGAAANFRAAARVR